VSVDDIWVYAGLPEPKSIIIPYLLSVRLPRGPFRLGVPIPLYRPEQGWTLASRDRQDRRSESMELAADLKEIGVQFVRAWFPWNFFEPKILSGERAVIQFPLDDFVEEMNAAGIKIVAAVGAGYERFLPEGIDTSNVETYLSRLANASEQIIGHYKGKISAWQIENEPNWWMEHYATHWRSGGVWLEPEIQQRILQRLHDAVTAQDPSSTIIVNLEADHSKTDWRLYCKFCDVLGLDFYPNYSHSSPVDASRLGFSSEVKRSAGLPVFVCETGYPSGPFILGYDNEKQTQYVKLACETAFENHDISGLSMWRHSDSYWHSFPEQENHFGLLDRGGQRKPAFEEFVSQVKDH
jgi:hypothetical protein